METYQDIPSNILELIYEAALDESIWGDALREISRWVEGFGAMYCLLDTCPPQPKVDALYSAGFTAMADEAYAERGHIIDPHMALGEATPEGEWFFSQDHFSRDFISRNAFFQEVMNPLGVRWVAGSRIWTSEDRVACFAIQKPITAAGFDNVDRRRLEVVGSHVARATRLQDRLRGLAFDAAAGIEATDGLRLGIALLDPLSHLMYSNGAAERMFANNRIFKCTRGRIALRRVACQAGFDRAMALAAGLRSTMILIRDQTGKAAINALVAPVTASSRWVGIWQKPSVMLTMSDMASAAPHEARSLQELFSLTPAEARVAAWVAAGQSIGDYANERGVSIETVRTQLKVVLAKTGMRRQAELVAYLARLPALATRTS